MAIQKCPICKQKVKDKAVLAEHVEHIHGNEIPPDWSGSKYIFYMKHGRTTGKCVTCKGETGFNEKTGKPFRFCKNPACKEVYREFVDGNMMRKYNKTKLTDDPEFQKKMLLNRKITKKYTWADGTGFKMCVGSYELDFAKFCDVMLDLPCEDVLMPAPMIIHYEYEGEKCFYIPDAYIASLDLVVEIKDGGDNPNMHHKIQDVDKVKEKLKEEAVQKAGFNYVKVENKMYDILLETFIKLKESDTKDPSDSRPVFMTREILSESITNSIRDYQDNFCQVMTLRDLYTGEVFDGISVKNFIYRLDKNGRLICPPQSRILKSFEYDKVKVDKDVYYDKSFFDSTYKDLSEVFRALGKTEKDFYTNQTECKNDIEFIEMYLNGGCVFAVFIDGTLIYHNKRTNKLEYNPANSMFTSSSTGATIKRYNFNGEIPVNVTNSIISNDSFKNSVYSDYEEYVVAVLKSINKFPEKIESYIDGNNYFEYKLDKVSKNELTYAKDAFMEFGCATDKSFDNGVKFINFFRSKFAYKDYRTAKDIIRHFIVNSVIKGGKDYE